MLPQGVQAAEETLEHLTIAEWLAVAGPGKPQQALMLQTILNGIAGNRHRDFLELQHWISFGEALVAWVVCYTLDRKILSYDQLLCMVQHFGMFLRERGDEYFTAYSKEWPTPRVHPDVELKLALADGRWLYCPFRREGWFDTYTCQWVDEIGNPVEGVSYNIAKLAEDRALAVMMSRHMQKGVKDDRRSEDQASPG